MRAFAPSLIAFAMLAGCAPVARPATSIPTFAAQDFATEWRAVGTETGALGEIADLERLARDFPDSGSVRLRLLSAQVSAGEFEGALSTLEYLYARGYVFSEAGQAQIGKLMAPVGAGRIAERLRATAEPIERSELVATVPAIAELPESVVRDPVTGRLLVTTVVGRSVYGVNPQGAWSEFNPLDSDNLSGIVRSPATGEFWVASGDIDQSDDALPAFAGLIKLGADGAKPVRLAAPAGGAPSDLAVSADGTFYASDPLSGAIYRGREGDASLGILVPAGTLRSPQGLAISADGTKLYVSDYRYGIAIVALTGGKIARLSTELPVLLDGIDGLWRHGNELVGVQNGTSPMQIVALQLSDDSMSVVGHRVLERSHREWTEPLSGSLDGDALLYIANGQWDMFVAGKRLEGKPPRTTQIRSLPLGMPNR
ncbi:SMP-30/gluconolactonase/LRE family protein [Qipengyuania zhejiangensis]|uniref:SMP-30/gluconolactonase/LRE family protein n=1 Tax=Qipengyuania zhejiangensis TaxID=3077782 RepID=UPI002D78FFB4|nr:hypothetical protein [Qipengyuania sp. Z2]